MSDYLKFEKVPRHKDKKTDTWVVKSQQHGFHLGMVYWYSPWRQYTFVADNVVLNPECLRAIADFVEAETKLHRQMLHERQRRVSVEASGESPTRG